MNGRFFQQSSRKLFGTHLLQMRPQTIRTLSTTNRFHFSSKQHFQIAEACNQNVSINLNAEIINNERATPKECEDNEINRLLEDCELTLTSLRLIDICGINSTQKALSEPMTTTEITHVQLLQLIQFEFFFIQMIDFEQIQQIPEIPLEEVVKKKTDIVSPEIYSTFISNQSIYIFNQIQKDTYESDFVDEQQFKDAQEKENFAHQEKFFAVFGQVNVQNVKFLILVHKARVATKIFDIPIYEVLSVQFLTISYKKYEDKSFEKCWENLSRIKNYIKSGFYFSYYYPLHHSFKGNNTFDNKLEIPIRKSCFVWNFNALSAFNTYLADSQFFLPFIQGFVGDIKTSELQMVLISRRSYFMGGTRYNSRGIDSKGNVANFVETEQILITQNRVCSYLQYRGSMPFYWGQSGIKAKIQVSEKHQENYQAFQKHLQQIEEDFEIDKITFFNLLGAHRNNENLLTEEFERLLGYKDQIKDKVMNVDYMYCDFHSITKEIDHTAVNDYIKNLMEKNSSFNTYEILDNQRFNLIQQQKDAIRSNCLDCLDRTNAVQTKISFLQLHNFLEQEVIDIFQDDQFNKDPLDYLQKSNKDFVNQFRILWADNGDNISIIYAGTGATTSSVTRKGQKSGITSMLDHGFKSISRFYLNNFEDQYKQEVIEQILNYKKSKQRQSLLNLDMMNIQRFQVAVICLFSIKHNYVLEFDASFIEKMFENTQKCDFVLFVFYNDEKKVIKIKQKEFKTYSHIKDIFNDFSMYLKDFEICKLVNNKKYQLVLFKKNSKDIQCQVFLEKKIKSIFWQQSQGHLVTLTLNNYPLQIFIVKTSSKQSDQSFNVQKIIQDYKDPKTNVMFVFSNVYREMQLEDIDDQLAMIYSNAIEFENENSLQNQAILLCLRQMIEKGIQPMEVNLDLDFENLQQGYALNSRIFVFFNHKIQKQIQIIFKIESLKLLMRNLKNVYFYKSLKIDKKLYIHLVFFLGCFLPWFLFFLSLSLFLFFQFFLLLFFWFLLVFLLSLLVLLFFLFFPLFFLPSLLETLLSSPSESVFSSSSSSEVFYQFFLVFFLFLLLFLV